MKLDFKQIKKVVKNIDKKQAGNLIKDFKHAKKDGKIDEAERSQLLDSAKKLISDVGSNYSNDYDSKKRYKK